MSGSFHRIDDVKRAARGGWPGVLTSLGVDATLLTDRHSPCPGCGGRDRFRFDDKEGDGTWLCSGGGNFESGDGIGLVMHVKGWDWKRATNEVGELLGLTPEGRASRPQESGVAAAPAKQREKVAKLYDAELLTRAVAGVEPVTPEWLMERSPVDPRGVMAGEFLEAIYEPGERALVFTNFYSQGDFAWEVGRGGFRLGTEPGVRAVKSALPLDGGKDGVWFLANPVSLAWERNPRKEGERSRRVKECVTGWKYLVLESDEAPAELWLRFLAIFPDAIRAIYSSGGKSWHALVWVRRDTWADMDGLLRGNPRARSQSGKLGAKAAWARFGADPAALTPVRLTRLPGCTRKGRVQRLVYLNPDPECLVDGKRMRIVDMVPRRKVVGGA